MKWQHRNPALLFPMRASPLSLRVMKIPFSWNKIRSFYLQTLCSLYSVTMASPVALSGPGPPGSLCWFQVAFLPPVFLSKAGYKSLEHCLFPHLTLGLDVYCEGFCLFCSEIKVSEIKKMRFYTKKKKELFWNNQTNTIHASKSHTFMNNLLCARLCSGTRDTVEIIMIKMEQREMVKASKTQEVGWLCLKL